MKRHLLFASLIATVFSMPVAGQSSFMSDMIGQAVANSMGQSGNPKSCYDGRMQAKPQQVAIGAGQVDAAFASYLRLASSSTDTSTIFVANRKMRHWLVDGQEQDVRAMRDPLANRIARIERTGLVTSNRGLEYHAAWRAIGADGSTLGTYDGWLVTWGKQGARFFSLDLNLPGSPAQAKPIVPFCYQPGDIEEWHLANAKREADKAARRAARAARR